MGSALTLNPRLTANAFVEAFLATLRICSIPGCNKERKGRTLCPTHLWRLKMHGTTDDRPVTTDCSVDQCKEPHLALGYCHLHYRRFKRYGHPELPKRVSRRLFCSVAGCETLAHGLGLCQSHYNKHKQSLKEISRARKGEGLAYLLRTLETITDECVLWPYASSRGYGVTYVNRQNVAAHRYACEQKHGPPPFEGAHAAHNCGNSMCVNWRHVRWATSLENNSDKWGHGTMARGERIARSKLDAEKVRYIRTSGERTCVLAALYGDDKNTIISVRNGRTWTHVA